MNPQTIPAIPAQTLPEAAIYGMIWVFGWAILLVVVWHLRGLRQKFKLELIHKERLAAMDKGIPMPEMPEYEEGPRNSALAGLLSQVRLNPRWQLGAGALFIMLGIGVTVALRLSGEDYHNRVWSFGLIPVFFGVGLWLNYALTRRENA